MLEIKGGIMPENKARLLFADAAVESLEAEKTLPAKFRTMLKKLNLPARVEGKTVSVKMHLGDNIGYTTIHPVFVRILVQALQAAGAKSVKIIDGKAQTGLARGYTQEVLGCPVVSCFGETGKYVYREPIGFRELDEALFSGEALDSDFFLDFSHVKGHGDCGFGGALKNIAMGVVTPETRTKLHHLEGGITFDSAKCIFCKKCIASCRYGAITPNEEKRKIEIFHHHCTYCQHCVMICPQGAITMEGRQFRDFSKGMALVTAAFLKKFAPENLLFINILTNITIYCDCWGFSSPALVPDIGILAGEDIAAVDTASLDLIKTEELLPRSLPKNRKIGESGHLFERIHGKDPYVMLTYLQEAYPCTGRYEMETVR
jgi:uncharacterized Fe-S center protein